MVKEYEDKLKEIEYVENANKGVAYKYKTDLANYEKAMKEYESQVSKIESDYEVAYNEYLKKLSDYESRKLKAALDYEKTYNDIAYKNAEGRRIYLEEKAKVEAENKKLKEEYEKEVADIKAANERAQKEYEEKLAKWKAEKTRVENTVKTKDLIDSVLTNKIDELKKKSVNITVGREEVTEVDGTSGKVSEGEARARLGELSKVKLAELDKAEKAKTAGDATNKEYSDRVNVVKSELGKLSNLSVNYTNGGVVGNVSSDVGELNKKLEQAKALNKLAGKVNELNSKISEHDKGIVGKLKAAGVSESDANTIYGKKTIVPASEFNKELEVLKKKDVISDSDIDAFISKVSNSLDTAKATVDKAIKAAKSGGTGEALDDVEYDKKWEEFLEKIKEYNKENDKILSGEINYAIVFQRHFHEIFDAKLSKLKNKAKVSFVGSTGEVKFYKPRARDPRYDSISKFFAYTSSSHSKNWIETNKLEMGTISTDDPNSTLEYARFILGKDASATFDFELPDGYELKDDNDNKIVTYKIVNGEKIITPVKKIRYRVRNAGSWEPDGSSTFILSNNIAAPFIRVFSNNNTEDLNFNHEPDYSFDISNTWNKKPSLEYFRDLALISSEGEELYYGIKYFEDDKVKIKSLPSYSAHFYEYKKKDNKEVNGNGLILDQNEVNNKEKPGNWDILEDRHSENVYELKDGKWYSEYENLYFSKKELSQKYMAGILTGSRLIDNLSRDLPRFNYIRKNTPVEVLETIPNTTNIDIPVKTPIPSSFTTINPVKVVYKYKETFTEKVPGQPPVKSTPDETTVHYKPVPKEPIPTKQPNKTPLSETPPTAPTKPTIPLPPTAPTEPKISTLPTTPTLNLPPLPQKPWEPDQPIEPRLPKTINLTVTVNEYVLKEAKISHANSLAIKHKLASFANSFQLRKL